MKYITRDLLTLLISLFILSSCENPDEIGLDIDPANQINNILIDTTTLRTVTVKEDTFITNGLLRHPVGYFQDAAIGKTEANLAVALELSTSGLTFGTSPVLDSAVLVLKYGKEFYGDLGSTYTLNVHQLNEKFNSSSYYNTKTWDYNPQVIGAKTINVSALNDSIRIIDIVKGAKDTQKVVASQIRIPISSSFINSNFLNAPSDKFTDPAKFNTFIKGLYVTLKKNQSEIGGIILLDLTTAGVSALELYYKNDVGGVPDTNVVRFAINSSSAAADIKHDYITPVQTQLNNPTQQFSTVYLQPMSGLRTKVTFPFLSSLKSLGNIIINKAELVVSVQGGTDAAFITAPRLTLYRSDIADQRQPVPDNDFGQTKPGYSDPRIISDFGGLYDASKKRYTFIITSYIQDMINGKLPQYDTFIVPISVNVNPAQNLLPASGGSTAARSIVGGGNSSNYKMKLNIIYTRLN